MATTWCDKLIDKCDAELDALSKKADLDDNNLARLKRWSQSLQALETVKAMRNAYPDAGSYGNYGAPPRVYWEPRRAYGAYDSPSGRWNADPYAGHGNMTLSALRQAMTDAQSERERSVLRRAIAELENP